MPDELTAPEPTEELVDSQEKPSEEEKASDSIENEEGSTEEEAGLSPEEKERRELQSKRDKLFAILADSDDRTEQLLAQYGYTKADVQKDSPPPRQTSVEDTGAITDDDLDGIPTRRELLKLKEDIVNSIRGEVQTITMSGEIKDAQAFLVRELSEFKDYLTPEDMAFAKNYLESQVASGIGPTDAAVFVKEILVGRAVKNATKDLKTRVEKETADRVRKIKAGQQPKTAGAPSPAKEEQEDPLLADLKLARRGTDLF